MPNLLELKQDKNLSTSEDTFYSTKISESFPNQLKLSQSKFRVANEIQLSFWKKESKSVITKRKKKIIINTLVEIISVESFKEFNKKNTYKYKKQCFCPIF
jgi:hypothetical protein